MFRPPSGRGAILFAPGVVDHEKDAPVPERLGELGAAALTVAIGGFRSAIYKVRGDGDQVFGLLAKLGPEDAVEIGLLDVRVVGKRFRERGLAITAGTS